MPYYLQRFKFGSASMKALIAKPKNRPRRRQEDHRSHGGKLHEYFLAFGAFDVVLIAEYPDNAAATAISLTVGASGAFTGGETTPLITMDEAVKAMTRPARPKRPTNPRPSREVNREDAKARRYRGSRLSTGRGLVSAALCAAIKIRMRANRSPRARSLCAFASLRFPVLA
ncbi:MAG: GYD domain-containing protein [Pseudomonadota bacterium]